MKKRVITGIISVALLAVMVPATVFAGHGGQNGSHNGGGGDHNSERNHQQAESHYDGDGHGHNYGSSKSSGTTVKSSKISSTNSETLQSVQAGYALCGIGGCTQTGEHAHDGTHYSGHHAGDGHDHSSQGEASHHSSYKRGGHH